MREITLTQSAILKLHECPRRYYHRYEEEIAPRGYDSAALRFGSLMHDCAWKPYLLGEPMERVVDGIVANAANKHELIHALCLFHAYDQRWPRVVGQGGGGTALGPVMDPHGEIDEVERSFKLRVPGRHKAYIGGTVDATIIDPTTGELGILEHKTTSRDLETWWESAQLKIQPLQYALAKGASFVVYNVARWMRQRKRHKGESDEGFAERLDQLYADHEKFFMRVRINISPDDLECYARRLSLHVEEVRWRRREDFWPRNEGSCEKWGRRCEYWHLCTAHEKDDELVREMLMEHRPAHEELNLTEGTDAT